MAGGYIIGDLDEEVVSGGSDHEPLVPEPPPLLRKRSVALELLDDTTDFPPSPASITSSLPPPSPLRPSLRLSRSSSISFNRKPPRPPKTPRQSVSSLDAPSPLSSTSTSLLFGDGTSFDLLQEEEAESIPPDNASSSSLSSGEESDTESEETDPSALAQAIPAPSQGMHFIARKKHFTIVPPPSSTVHRVVTVQLRGSKVQEINSRRPFGAPSSSFSHEDVSLSAKGENHTAIVRRTAKSNKVFVTVHRRENDKLSHYATKHTSKLLHDFSSTERSSAVLAMHGSSLFLVGNQAYDHVWRLDLTNPSEGLEWVRDEHKTIPRPNTKPKHRAGSPRVGFAWRDSIIVIGVEVISKKASNLPPTPYTSPKPKPKASTSKKSKKGKERPESLLLSNASTASLSQPPPSPSSTLLELNIWQYSMPNHTWTRRDPSSAPPQGFGNNWPPALCGCLVGDDVACVAVGRADGTCIWALNLRTLGWTEISGVLPPGSRVHAMSSVGTTVYFMGTDLAPNSSVVHCDMSLFAPWSPSSQTASTHLQVVVFPEPQILESTPEPESPTTPTDNQTHLLIPIHPASPITPPPAYTKSNKLTTEGLSVAPDSKESPACSPSILPSYGLTPEPLSPGLAMFLFWTPYRVLHEARDDARFEVIKNGLISEWATCAMTLMGFIAVDAAILGLSRDGTIIPVDEWAIKAIAVSILTALIGVTFTCWLYILYYSQDGEIFRNYTRDTLNTYAFFSIRARMPMLAVMVTLGSFAFFVYHVLMQVAPDVVLPIFIITGIVVGLNFFVFIFFFVKWVGVRMWRGVKWVGALVGLGRRPTDVLPVAPEVVEVKVSGDPPIRMPVPIVEVSQYRPTEKA